MLAAVGALLIGGLPTAAILLASDETSSDSSAHAKAWHHGNGQGHGHAYGHDKANGKDKHGKQKGNPRHGRGAPPWALGPGQRQGPGAGQLRRWQQQWQGLTPEQRAKKMAALAKQHADQMQSWATCVATSNTPAKCKRPLPPGLAKRVSPPPPQG